MNVHYCQGAELTAALSMPGNKPLLVRRCCEYTQYSTRTMTQSETLFGVYLTAERKSAPRRPLPSQICMLGTEVEQLRLDPPVKAIIPRELN